MNLLVELRKHSLEPDQRIAAALAAVSADPTTRDRVWDSEVFFALHKLNAISARFLDVNAVRLPRVAARYATEQDSRSPRGEIREAIVDHPVVFSLFTAALRDAQGSSTFGVRNFLKAVLDKSLRHGDAYALRPFTLDALVMLAGYEHNTPLSEVPEAHELLSVLRQGTYGDDDFQYALGLEGSRIVFRPVSVLGDYVQEQSGLLVPRRAILTHLRDAFGIFTQDEIEELEELLNNHTAKELDFQRYFERHPHFLRKWDYREVYPHVTLARPDGPLVPDFILTDRQLQRAAIVELKLPSPKFIRRQDNRERFADAVMEARAQLLRYRDWFREDSNRTSLKQRLGMVIYEPQLIAIIGRASEFVDEFDRQRLRANTSDIEVVTYDDILTYAERRRVMIS